MCAVEELVHHVVRKGQEAKQALALSLFILDIFLNFHVEEMPSSSENFLSNYIRAALAI